jgi:hypothetical protein
VLVGQYPNHMRKLAAKIREIHYSYHLAFLVCIILRIPSLRQELPPYLFCDENLYAGEAFSLFSNGGFVADIFRAGGVNIYSPILFSSILSLIGFGGDSYSNFIIEARILMVILNASTVYVLLAIISLFTKSKLVHFFTIGGFVVSPYVLSLSRQWYPDHFIVLFVSIFLYYFLINYSDSFSKSNYLKLNISFALLLSTKYTTLIFLPLVWIVVYKHLVIRVSRKSIFKSNLIGFFVFLIINFSIFFHPRKFLTDFFFNLQNYGQSEGIHFRGITYNFAVLLFLVFGIPSCILILTGAKLAFKTNLSIPIRLFTLVCVLYLISMGQALITLNRNLMIFVPLILIFLGLGSGKFWQMGNSKFSSTKILVLIVYFACTINSCYIFLHDFEKDSRVIAASRLGGLIPPNTIVGVNEACSGSSPAGEAGFEILYDPFLKDKLPYYVINSYWPSPYQALYSKNGFLQEFDQKYIHFYLFSNTEFWKLSFTPRVWDTVDGYEVVKVFNSNGPDVIVLKKSTK